MNYLAADFAMVRKEIEATSALSFDLERNWKKELSWL